MRGLDLKPASHQRVMGDQAQGGKVAIKPRHRGTALGDRQASLVRAAAVLLEIEPERLPKYLDDAVLNGEMDALMARIQATQLKPPLRAAYLQALDQVLAG